MERDIFEDFRELVGCDFISDQPYRKEAVLDAMERVRFSDYPPEKVTEFLNYVF